MAPISLLAIFCVWQLKLKKQLDTSSWLSLTLRNSFTRLLLSETLLREHQSALCPQNGRNCFRSGSVLVPEYFLCPQNSSVGKSHAALYIKNSAYGFKNFQGLNTSVYQSWVGCIHVWWLRDSFLKLFSIQQNYFNFYVGGRKWNLWSTGGTANLNLEKRGNSMTLAWS